MYLDSAQYGGDAVSYSASTAVAADLRRHILVVGEDAANRERIADYLGQNELRVTAVPYGAAMHAALEEGVVDLVLLHLKLKSENGMSLAKRLRELSAIPLIILADRAEEADKVMGLEMGADDYITQPFGPRELLARIRAVLRRLRRELRQGRPNGRLLRPQGHQDPGRRECLSRRAYAAPKNWAERAYPKLIHYNRLEKGGHFAAWEQPEFFVSELRASFRSLRA